MSDKTVKQNQELYDLCFDKYFSRQNVRNIMDFIKTKVKKN